MSQDDGNQQDNYNYWNQISDAASTAAFQRNDEDPRLSAEAIPANAGLIDFAAFLRDYPDKLFPLLEYLRPEFREIFLEYYALHKTQSFLAQTHGCTVAIKICQQLRLIEQALGALIVLGTNPTEADFQIILTRVGINQTKWGSLSHILGLYKTQHSFVRVAKEISAPTPAIRKILRPAIQTLQDWKSTNPDFDTRKAETLAAMALGSYLRALLYQVSLNKTGFSKQHLARARRIKQQHFNAPSPNKEFLTSFGRVETIHDTPWHMLEISSEHQITKILPTLRRYAKRIFGKNAAQIFAPLDAQGNLRLSYVFVRCASFSLIKRLTSIRGISEIVARYENDVFVEAVTVPHTDILPMIQNHTKSKTQRIKKGMFVKILAGEATNYYGTVQKTRGQIIVRVDFPTGRCFLVKAQPDALEPVDAPPDQRRFWGISL